MATRETLNRAPLTLPLVMGVTMGLLWIMLFPATASLTAPSSEPALTVFVFPNPIRAHQPAFLHIESGNEGRFHTRIYDVSGEMIYENLWESSPSAQTAASGPLDLKLDFARIRPGVYTGLISNESNGKPTAQKKFRFSVVK